MDENCDQFIRNVHRHTEFTMLMTYILKFCEGGFYKSVRQI